MNDEQMHRVNTVLDRALNADQYAQAQARSQQGQTYLSSLQPTQSSDTHSILRQILENETNLRNELENVRQRNVELEQKLRGVHAQLEAQSAAREHLELTLQEVGRIVVDGIRENKGT